MKRDRFSSLGVGQNIKRAWLEATLDMVIAQTSPEETRKRLFAIVSGSETKDGLRGKESAKKVLSMLSAWFVPKEECLAVFAGQMLKIAQQCLREERVALHWAILSATYPFFMEVSLVAGRLFGMQESIFRQQIQRRLEEMRGASSTIGRNLEYALWILCDLGLLRMGNAKGEYLKCDPLPIVNRSVAAALWKAILLATKGGSASISRLRASPAFFAFSMSEPEESDFDDFFPDVEFSGGIGSDDILTITGQ